jgi:hypothetical protein
MLVYEQDGNVLALGGEAIKSSLDVAVLGFGVDDKEVLLRVWRLCDVLVVPSALGSIDISVGWESLPQCPQAACPSPSPGAVS